MVSIASLNWRFAIAFSFISLSCIVLQSEEKENALYLGQQVSGLDSIQSIIGKEGDIQEFKIDNTTIVFTSRKRPHFGVHLVEVCIWLEVHQNMQLVHCVLLKNTGKPKIVYDKETRYFKLHATLNSYLKDKEVLSVSADALTKS